MAKALVLVTEGSEEIETLATVDVLRRAQVEVTLAGLKPGPLTLSRGVRILADADLDAVVSQTFDAVLVPGGPGHAAMMQDARVSALLLAQAGRGGLVAAICAAPKVLAKAGLLNGKKATWYPGSVESLGLTGITHVDQAVVADGNIVTGKGPGTTLPWALHIAEMLAGRETRQKVEAAMQH